MKPGKGLFIQPIAIIRLFRETAAKNIINMKTITLKYFWARLRLSREEIVYNFITITAEVQILSYQLRYRGSKPWLLVRQKDTT